MTVFHIIKSHHVKLFSENLQ